ncbi:MAG TPA: metallophosphoesterase, partial [bacterium]|nr:metallophosphoesterase [bacterium]
LAAIADTHLGTILGADWMKALVNRVERERPDAILLLGDILEGYGNDPEELIPVLRGLAAPLGVWSVPGNHESYGRETVTREILDGAGFNQLFNTHTEPLPGLVLAGIDYRREREGEENDERLVQALGGKPEGVAILLSHSPAPAEAAAGAGVDLMLSGHTHGGQIWPWSLLVKTRHPWLAGHYRVGSMQIIVSRGAGTWGPRMRLWQPGEVSIVVLHRADAGLETSTPDYSD